MNDLDNEPLLPDLSVRAVEDFLAADPRLDAIAQTLMRCESWAFDYGSVSEPLSPRRERMLDEAGQALLPYLSQLQPSSELVEFFVALTTRWRLYLLFVLDEWQPGLVPGLARFAHERCDDSASCAHFVHWLDTIDYAQELMSEVQV